MKTYIIATAHDEYRRREFPKGSTVIDPWRMIDPQEGVNVLSLGRNRPETISLLVPTRGRPDSFYEMVESARRLAVYPRSIEVVAYIDRDDPARIEYLNMQQPVRLLTGERMLLSVCWNECYLSSKGELLMHMGDDVLFQTDGWDQIVREAFRSVPDRILFAYGDDLGPNGKVFGTHGVMHRRWVETLGYFVPPLFSSDWNDVWLNEVAEKIGRKQLLPFVTEHLHYTFGKMDRDQTHADREERGERDGVVDLYKSTAEERARDAEKLRSVMK